MEKNPAAIMPQTADSKIQYTTEDGFLMTIPQDLEYNKTECTDVSIISTTEAQPKMPLVSLYSNLSSTMPVLRKVQTQKLFLKTQGSRIPSIPSPQFFQVQEGKDSEEDSVPTNFVFPKETSSYLGPVKPKTLFKSLRSEVTKSSDLSKNAAIDVKFTSKQIVHTNSSSISSGSGSSPGSPAAEFSNRSPSKRHSSQYNPWNQTRLSHLPPSNLPNSQRTLGNFSWHLKKLTNENSTNSKAESSQQHFTKRTSFANFARTTSLFKFFTGSREPSSQALGMINDKSYVQTDPRTPNFKSVRRQSTPKLTRLLKKHAISGGITHSGTQLFNLIAVLKKKRMGFFEKLGMNLRETCVKFKQNMRTTLNSLRYFLKPLRPESLLRWIWDGIILIFIIVSLVTVPFSLCFRFSNSVIADDQTNLLETSNIIMFLLDILVNFHTAYYFDGNIVFESKSIALNYLRTWFFFDLLASFPYQLVAGLMEEPVFSPDGNIINPFKSPKFLIKFMGILQLIRVFKLRILLAKFETHLELNRLLNGIFRLVKLFTMVSFIAHWCACGWHFLAVDLENGDWLTRVGLEGATIEDRYIVSLYFCLTTLLTVGFGDILPQTSMERVYTILIMLIGGCVFGYVMNSIAVIIYSLEDEKTKVRNKITSLCKYMQKEGLAKDVQHDIKKYLEFLVEGSHAMKQSDKEMLDMLSQDLRGRFYEQMNGKLLYGSKLLANNFTKRFLYTISAAIGERTYTPHEKVFDHLDTEYSVFYILRGCIEFFHVTGVSPALILKSGHTFGEIAFFSNMPRILSAKSVEFSRLLFIKREKFLETLDDFPHDKEMFCMIKDRIVNYQEYEILDLKCAVCQESDHLLEKCPQVRYVPDAQEIVKNHLEEVARFRKSFQRIERKRFHALISLKPIEIACFNMCRNHFDKLMEIRGPDVPSLCLDETEEQRSKSIGRPSFSLPLHNNTNHKSHVLSESAPKNLRFSTLIVKDASRDTKTILAALNSRKLEDMKLHPETVYNAQMTFKIKDGELIPVDDDFEDLENFVFDRVMTYPVYFPHNNINKIVDRMEKKEKGTAGQSSEEIKKLKHHLRRFFKALEKQRAREKLTSLPLRKTRSRSILRIFSK